MFNTKSNNGFTLVEMIVALFAFSIILTIIGSVFVSAVVSQRRALNAQKVEENLNQIMEAVTRELRVAQPTPTTGVFDTISDHCTVDFPSSANSIDFFNSTGQRVKYILVGTDFHRQLLDSVTGNIISNGDTIMNSNAVQFTNLQFCVRGISTYGLQPRVTIIATIQSTQTDHQIIDFYQTTVSFRFLGI